MQDDAAMRGGQSVGVMEALLVIAPDPELDAEAAELPVRQLRAEIAGLDVDSVRPGPADAAPDGAKGTDPLALGAIVVAFSASGGVFTALIETVRDWLDRSSARHRVSVTIDGDTIELERASDAERRDLVAAYIRRHTGS
ncbi:effector-associated constant component EACC1 [Streptomyces sp. NBC_00459]|uniref:effector-associated constant component EACC1 n=1 Tax=Streptomyces sp. NBC_00459 TaxID=2975749 RepID=UPI002E172B04